jgi:hypothetical protein
VEKEVAKIINFKIINFKIINFKIIKVKIIIIREIFSLEKVLWTSLQWEWKEKIIL